MTLEEYKARLDILLEQKVISQKANETAFFIYSELLRKLNRNNLEQAEMLFTHLPMALERCKDGSSTIEGPSAEIMNEIYQTDHFPLAKEQVESIEKVWGVSLPEEERNYLYMHYTTVLNINLEEEVK